ncbi:MAG: DUF502 domain-containing protein [Candidatus Omnitrophota bacterium]
MKRVWNGFFINFINGIVILLPVIITVALIRFLVLQMNKMVLDPIMGFFAPMISGPYRVYAARIVIFCAVVFTVAMFGWGAKIIFIKRIFVLGERLLLNVPVMGKFYNAAKQIFSAFFGHGKTIFKQVVLIEYPRKGLYSVGFITGLAKGEIKGEIGPGGVNVFVPTTPNPTSGVFLAVPKSDVCFLKMSVEEGMKLVISGGSVAPDGE